MDERASPAAAAAGLGEDHALLTRAVREAGAIALRHFRRGAEGWHKRPGQPVSEADLAVDAYLRDALVGARPEYGWLSEESAESAGRRAARRVWVVDPIDGTRAFLKGRDEFAVAVALVEAGQPVCGAVYNPATEEFFEATAGGGARLNGAPIRVARVDHIAGARIVMGRREAGNVKWHDSFGAREVVGISSIAYKLAVVAAGRADATISLSPKSDWDVAAAAILIAEAGGVTSRPDGGPLRYNQPQPRSPGVIAANPALHRLLVARLAGR